MGRREAMKDAPVPRFCVLLLVLPFCCAERASATERPVCNSVGTVDEREEGIDADVLLRAFYVFLLLLGRARMCWRMV